MSATQAEQAEQSRRLTRGWHLVQAAAQRFRVANSNNGAMQETMLQRTRGDTTGGGLMTPFASPRQDMSVFVEFYEIPEHETYSDPEDPPEQQIDVLERKINLQGLDSESEGVSVEMCCPITHDVMQDPVMAVDGYLYDRFAIQRAWSIRKMAYSPMTTEKLRSDDLFPCHPMRHMIERAAAAHACRGAKHTLSNKLNTAGAHVSDRRATITKGTRSRKR